MSHALRRYEFEGARHISSAPLLRFDLASPMFGLSAGLPPLAWFSELEKNKSSGSRKKIPGKRLPVIYLPGPVTFPQISFMD